MPSTHDLATRLKRLGGLVGLLVLAGCAQPQQMAAVPAAPIPPGEARIWFYRVYDPSLSRNLANVDLNGVRVVSVLPSDGPVFRDVAPGAYRISPETIGVAVNQSRDVNLAAGQAIYIKVLDDPTWMSGGDRTAFQRDTFYVWLMPPAVAQAEMNMRPM